MSSIITTINLPPYLTKYLSLAFQAQFRLWKDTRKFIYAKNNHPRGPWQAVRSRKRSTRARQKDHFRALPAWNRFNNAIYHRHYARARGYKSLRRYWRARSHAAVKNSRRLSLTARTIYVYSRNFRRKKFSRTRVVGAYSIGLWDNISRALMGKLGFRKIERQLSMSYDYFGWFWVIGSAVCGVGCVLTLLCKLSIPVWR